MIIIKTLEFDKTFALRHDTDTHRVEMHIGMMDGGAILPRMSVSLTAHEVARLMTTLQDLYQEMDKP